MCLQYKSFETTVGKVAHNKQFLHIPRCFLPFWRTFWHFHQICNCYLPTLSVWKSLKFAIWERVKGKGEMFAASNQAGKKDIARSKCVLSPLLKLNSTVPTRETWFSSLGRQISALKPVCSEWAISPFPKVFSSCFKNFLPFSSNLKSSAACSFHLEESEICFLGKS